MSAEVEGRRRFCVSPKGKGRRGVSFVLERREGGQTSSPQRGGGGEVVEENGQIAIRRSQRQKLFVFIFCKVPKSQKNFRQ
jgi:hypothetical protein